MKQTDHHVLVMQHPDEAVALLDEQDAEIGRLAARLSAAGAQIAESRRCELEAYAVIDKLEARLATVEADCRELHKIATDATALGEVAAARLLGAERLLRLARNNGIDGSMGRTIDAFLGAKEVKP